MVVSDAKTISVRSGYSEWLTTGPLIADMTGTSMSRKAVSIRIPSLRIRVQKRSGSIPLPSAFHDRSLTLTSFIGTECEHVDGLRYGIEFR